MQKIWGIFWIFFALKVKSFKIIKKSNKRHKYIHKNNINNFNAKIKKVYQKFDKERKLINKSVETFSLDSHSSEIEERG